MKDSLASFEVFQRDEIRRAKRNMVISIVQGIINVFGVLAAIVCHSFWLAGWNGLCLAALVYFAYYFGRKVYHLRNAEREFRLMSEARNMTAAEHHHDQLQAAIGKAYRVSKSDLGLE